MSTCQVIFDCEWWRVKPLWSWNGHRIYNMNVIRAFTDLVINVVTTSVCVLCLILVLKRCMRRGWDSWSSNRVTPSQTRPSTLITKLVPLQAFTSALLTMLKFIIKPTQSHCEVQRQTHSSASQCMQSAVTLAWKYPRQIQIPSREKTGFTNNIHNYADSLA